MRVATRTSSSTRKGTGSVTRPRLVPTPLKSAILSLLEERPRTAPALHGAVMDRMGMNIPIRTFYDALQTLEEQAAIIRPDPGVGKGAAAALAAIEAFVSDPVLRDPHRRKAPKDSAAKHAAQAVRLTDQGRRLALLESVEQVVPAKHRRLVVELRRLLQSHAG